MALTLEFDVRIGGVMHRIRVALPSGDEAFDRSSVERFVMITAYMEHFGFLPQGVVNAVA